MGLFKRDRVWWMRFNYRGRQIRKSTEVSDKRLAEKIYCKIMTQIAEGKWFDKPVETPKTFSEMAAKYLSEYSISKTESGKNRDFSIIKVLNPFFGDLIVSNIAPALIVQYKKKRRKNGTAPATIERELCLMKRAYNLAVKEWGWVTENPVAKVSREKFNNQIDRWLSSEEEERLLNACPEWLRSIMTFALNTGMRQGEIRNLKWKDVDLFRRTAAVMQSKNGEKRTIPLNKNVMEVLKRKSKVRFLKCEYVFSSKVGTKLEKRNLARAFYIAMEKANVSNFRFHDLRHTFATRLTQAGIDLYKVAKLLGHKDIRVTQRYAHHFPESLRDGVEILDRISERKAQNSTILAQSRVSKNVPSC